MLLVKLVTVYYYQLVLISRDLLEKGQMRHM